jgi:hypothetical protein
MTVNGRYYTIELCAVLFEVLNPLPYGRSQTFRNLTVVYSFCVLETLFEDFLYEAVARINLPFIYPGVHPRFVAKALRKRSLSSHG